MKALVLMTFTSLADAPPESWRSPLLLLLIAKDCLLTLVKSRLALGSPGCSWPCRKWPNTQENGCCLPPSDHIQSKILFQTKQDQERGMNGPASLLHSWHWVLFHFKLIFWIMKNVLGKWSMVPKAVQELERTRHKRGQGQGQGQGQIRGPGQGQNHKLLFIQ